MLCSDQCAVRCGQSVVHASSFRSSIGDSRVPPPACVRQSSAQRASERASCCRPNNCYWPTASWYNFPVEKKSPTLSWTPTPFPTHGRNAHQVGGVVRGASRALATAAAPFAWETKPAARIACSRHDSSAMINPWRHRRDAGRGRCIQDREEWSLRWQPCDRCRGPIFHSS